MESINSFGYWLRRRRKALDLTQDALARQAGCALGTLKKIETDERRPSRQLAERLADCLAIPTAERAVFLKAARAELATDQLVITAPLIEATAVERFPSGTVTFLFTDIERSTQLWEQHPQAMQEALARHDAILRAAIAAHAGVVFNTAGDAFHAAFTVAADALDAVLAAQRALRAEAWGPIGPIQVRAALHVGAAQQRDGDYFGQPLNRVARLCAAGHGGQVLLSTAAQELVRDALPKGAALRDLGEHRLKDLARPERIFQIISSDLPADFAALRTLDRYRHNLPPQPTPLIGREAEVATVCDQLRRNEVRLLTLTGPGGTGKTRLSLQVAADALDMFEDGVWFVNLAPIRDPQLVAAAIAQVLGVKEVADRPLAEQLKLYVREKQLLLLLDNFEQVAAAAPLIAELLAAAPHLKVLVTSREMLHLYGEREYAVPTLSLPDIRRLPPIEQLTQYEAVWLFIERAQAVRPDFEVTSANAPAVAEICTRLDGLPLAIELAAARSKLFPPQALLARLDQRLVLLTGGARDLPARQQTIRAAIDWSYQLLTAEEQTLFRRLGVFVGGWTLAVAAEVLRTEGQGLSDGTMDSVLSPQSSVLDTLASLLDKSLLKQEEGPDDEPRFTMLETIREYALERLAASGETEELRRRHAECFLALAETAEPQLHGPDPRTWLDRIEVEHDNLRAALAWSLEVPRAGAQSPSDQLQSAIGLRLAAALWLFWDWRGYLPEGLRWLEHTLAADRGIATPGRVKALVAASCGAGDADDLELAWALGEEGLALARRQEDPHGIAWSLWALGGTATSQNNFATARPLFAESLVLFRALGDTWGQFAVLSQLGLMARRQGDYSEVATRYHESLALARAMEHTFGIALALGELGSLAQALGDYDQAAALLTESLALFQELGEKASSIWIRFHLGNIARHQGDNTRAIAYFAECLAWFRETASTIGIAACLEGIAQVAIAAAQPVPAVRLFGAAAAIRDARGHPPHPDEQHEYNRLLAAARAQFDEATFAAVWAAGQALTLEQAIAEALAGAAVVA